MDMRNWNADFDAKISLLTSGLLVLFLAQWAVADSKCGMVLISPRKATVGTADAERAELGERFNCHPSWLGDDLPKHEGNVKSDAKDKRSDYPPDLQAVIDAWPKLSAACRATIAAMIRTGE